MAPTREQNSNSKLDNRLLAESPIGLPSLTATGLNALFWNKSPSTGESQVIRRNLVLFALYRKSKLWIGPDCKLKALQIEISSFSIKKSENYDGSLTLRNTKFVSWWQIMAIAQAGGLCVAHSVCTVSHNLYDHTARALVMRKCRDL